MEGIEHPNNRLNLIEDLFQIKVDTSELIDESPFAKLKIRINVKPHVVDRKMIQTLYNLV